MSRIAFVLIGRSYPPRRELAATTGFMLRRMHVIGTAGHVDHGKSTLVERLTGIDPDRFEEEKRRGLTIDLGFAWLPLPSGNEVGLIDVPGHERFIKNMLAGAGGISICMFVVAANEGWMPQSAEHLAILDALRVRSGVVVLTKSDQVDEATLERTRTDVNKRLGVSSLRDAPVIACSATTGEGLEALVGALDDVVSRTPAPPDTGRPRLWVDRVFTIAGAGTVVTGSLMGGTLSVGMEVEIAPEGRKARIRALQSHKKTLTSAAPGNRVALNLAGLERAGAQRGDAIVSPGGWRSTRRFDAHVEVFEERLIGEAHELTARGAHLLYVGSAETPVRISLLGVEQSLRGGQSTVAQLYARDPLVLQRGDRFVLRDAGRMLTFGGGVVLDPVPPQARRSDTDYAARLRALTGATPAEALDILVRSEGRIDRNEALLRSGSDQEEGAMVRIGGYLVSKDHVNQLTLQVQKSLAEHHDGFPLEPGMGREQLRAEVALEGDSFDALLDLLDDVVAEGSRLRLSSFAVALSPEQTRERDRVLQAIGKAGFSPPTEKSLGADPALIRTLVSSGDLVPVGGFFFTRRSAEQARQVVRAHISSGGPITVAQIRDVLGTSRRYAVPLCEWLDATGATRRQGDLRMLGPRP